MPTSAGGDRGRRCSDRIDAEPHRRKMKARRRIIAEREELILLKQVESFF